MTPEIDNQLSHTDDEIVVAIKLKKSELAEFRKVCREREVGTQKLLRAFVRRVIKVYQTEQKGK